jgi:hypothetical protein
VNFLSARLDPDGVQNGHKDVYGFGHERPYVQWDSLWFMLPCTGMLVVGVQPFERGSRSQVSWVVVVCDFYCGVFWLLFFFDRLIALAPASPFIASKGRVRLHLR